jgi:hypothetical protein
MAPESDSHPHPLPRRTRAAPRRAACAAALAALLATGPAAAQSFLYVCTVNGHTISSQLLPSECKNVDVRELNADGTLHRLIPAPLTPEQRKAKHEEEEKRLLEEEAARKQRSQDKALMETYSSVDEIEGARKRAIAGQQTLVDRADARIAQYKRERKHLDDEAEFYVKREMPRKLKDELASNQALTEQQEKTKADSLAKMKTLNERFDGERKRFEEIERMYHEAEEARRRTEEQNNN